MKHRLKDLLFSEPRVLHFQLEDRCNMACPMCNARSHRASRFDRLSLEEIKTLLLAPFRFAGGRRLVLSGGEPTLSEDLYETLEYAVRLGVSVSFFTNLYRVKSEQMRKILEIMSGGRHRVFTSYDSAYPDEMETIRGIDAHENLTSNLLSLVEMKEELKVATEIGVGLVLQERNCRSLADTLEFLLNLDVYRVIVTPIHLYGEIDSMNFSRVEPPCSRERLPDMLRAIETVFRLAAKSERIILPYPDIQRWRRHFVAPSQQQGVCHSDRYVFVNCHGDYRGCLQSRAYANVREIRMVDFLASEVYGEHRQLLSKCNICTSGCS